MTREEVIARLKSTEGDLRALGIVELYLFGSYARGEPREGSDVDVLIDPASPDGCIGFRPYFGALRLIESRLGKRVDLVVRRTLHRLARPDVERNAVQVF
jgi:predicted nucleotidyltransferase